MNSRDKLDRRIDALLLDEETKPGLGFTARVLERVSEDRSQGDAPASHRQSWWFLLPIAAAIALALFLQSEEPDASRKITGGVGDSSPSQSAKEKNVPVEIEEILVMEESLRGFEILFDDDALEILALLDE